jgi:hypothetical protein
MHRWKDNAKLCLRETGEVDLFCLVQNGITFCILMTKVMKLRVSYEVVNFLTSLANMDFSINTYRHRKGLIC